jgi:hypothetical protein
VRRNRRLAWLWFGVVVVVVVGGVALSMMGPPLLTGASKAGSPAGARQAVATTVMLTTSPASPVAQGTPVVLTATVNPPTAVGSVQFMDGIATIGPSVMVTNGTASGTTSSLPGGSHSLTAVFTPANPASYAPAVSPVVVFVVTGATATTITLATSPASPVASGVPVTLTATVAPPTAVGMVQFKDGANNLGNPVTVMGGSATGTTSTLVSGSHPLTAVFAPTDPHAFSASTSPPVTMVVTGAAATSVALATSPESPVSYGTPVTLTATITPLTAAGTVQFKDGTTNLGNPVAVVNGMASGSTSKLAVGRRSLTATFTPANPAAFSPSTSPPVEFIVTGTGAAGGATATSTGLTTNPASPVSHGTTVTLIAAISPVAAVGTVQFKDGTVNLGNPAVVSNGVATTTTSTLAVGGHRLTAVFSPTNPAVFGSSTSPVLAFEVTSGGLADLQVCGRVLKDCPTPHADFRPPGHVGRIDAAAPTALIDQSPYGKHWTGSTWRKRPTGA